MAETPALTIPPVLVPPRDLSAYRAGNTGVDYCHRFDSGVPGPSVVVNGLMHGNEFCGMSVITRLLDDGFRPKRGTLTLTLANIAAYESFDAEKPGASRFVEEDMNRVWTASRLAGTDGAETVEIARARELWPLFEGADRLLDLHTTLLSRVPFWVLPSAPRAAELARRLPVPAARLQLKPGGMLGTPVIDYGPFADPVSRTIALVAECGQHWAPEAQDVALVTTLAFLAEAGIADAEDVARYDRPIDPGPAGLFKVTADVFAKTDDWRYARNFTGFDRIEPGEILAYDGDDPVTGPPEGCWVALARPYPKAGGEAMTLAHFDPAG